MSFRFDGANCVAVGTFNIYIIQPAWLSERGIIPRDVKVAINSKLDEPGFQFSSPDMRARWVVTPSLIEVSTRDPNEDCGKLVGLVLDSLPWTPLKAVGCNTFFKAPPDDAAALSGMRGFAPEAPGDCKLEQRSVHVSLRRGDLLFNLQLAAMEKSIDLDINVHTDVTRGDRRRLARETMGAFFDHRREAERLIADVFKVSVTYGNSDPLPASETHDVPA